MRRSRTCFNPRWPGAFKGSNSAAGGVLLVVLTLLLSSPGATATPQQLSAPVQTATLSKQSRHIGDSTWSWYEGGSGPTLVLVHGFASSKDTWLSMGQRLSARFHVVIPDLPGWGESSRVPGASYNIVQQSDRLGSFVEDLNLRDVTVVGHSMGGAISGVFAAEHPQRVAGLVLISPQGVSFTENDFMRLLSSGANPFVYKDRAGVENMARWVYLNPPVFTDKKIEQLVAENTVNSAFIDLTLKEILPASQMFALDSRLAKLSIPVLGIGCETDKIIDRSAFTFLSRGLVNAPSKEMVMLEGCNHLPMQERSFAVEQLLESRIEQALADNAR